MQRLIRLLSPVSWPIWIKLSALVVVVLALVTFIVYLMMLNLRAIDLQNLQTYLIEQGESQRAAVTDLLNDSRAALNTYASDPHYHQAMVNMLLADAPLEPGTAPMSSTDMQLIFEDSILANELFSGVRLLNLEGLLVATAGGRVAQNVVGTQNESNTEAFQAGETARLLNRSQEMVVSRRGISRIEIVQVLYLLDGTPVGYLVVTVNTAQTLVPILRGGEAQYIPAFSYLVRRNSQELVIFTPSETRARAEDSALTASVQQALGGLRERESVEEYIYATDVIETLSDGSTATVLRETAVVGYYTNIPDTELILIIEASTESTFIDTFFSLVNGNFVFVLAIALPFLAAILIAMFTQMFSAPLSGLRHALRAMSAGDFNEPVPAAARADEFGQLATTFVDMREQVKELIAELEERIEVRGRDIQATQEIARFAATQRDIQLLMERVVELIVQFFPNIYHAQIFLVDSDRKYATLRASTGEAGRKLLERGHRLAVGSLSVIGRVTELGQYIVARDTTASEVHRRNEFLPETRSELAIPLRVGTKIIGALDVQSKRSNIFTDEDINVLQTMGDQIAIAIENANLYQESLRSLEEIERTKRRTTLMDWESYMQVQRTTELMSEFGTQTGLDTSDLRRAAIEQNRVVVGQPTERRTIAFAVPISLRGQVLGAAEWELPLSDFGEDKVLLAQELVNRLAVSVENARLFQQSQLATERERLVNTISTKLTAKQDINDILQTALREVGQALRAPEVTIRMNWGGKPTNGSAHSSDSADSSDLSDSGDLSDSADLSASADFSDSGANAGSTENDDERVD